MPEVMVSDVLARMLDCFADEPACAHHGRISSVNGGLNAPANFAPGASIGAEGVLP